MIAPVLAPLNVLTFKVLNLALQEVMLKEDMLLTFIVLKKALQLAIAKVEILDVIRVLKLPLEAIIPRGAFIELIVAVVKKALGLKVANEEMLLTYRVEIFALTLDKLEINALLTRIVETLFTTDEIVEA